MTQMKSEGVVKRRLVLFSLYDSDGLLGRPPARPAARLIRATLFLFLFFFSFGRTTEQGGSL